MPSIFAGKILHWTSQGLYYERTAADPANGKLLIGDLWMALDAHGLPTAYHYRYTYPDGQLHQESYEDRTSSIVVWDPDYRRPNVPVPPGWCVTPMQASAATLIRDLLGQYPLFAISTKLGPMMGLHDVGMRPLTVAPPSTASLPGVVPVAHEETPATADVWASSQFDPIDMAIGTTQLSLGPMSRVVYQATKFVTLGGRTGLNAWTVYGRLDVCEPSDVPPTLFKVPADIGKECAP